MCLFLPCFLLAQKKGDNTIIIPNDVNMSLIKSVLFKNGYAITTSDSLFISTSEKEMEKSVMVLRIMIARIDSVTYLKAHCKSSVNVELFGNKAANEFELLAFGGQKKSPYRMAWEELDKIAKMISPTVSYIKQ
jgi:hypothetical protein